MRIWRISDHADLKGQGGRLADGRWHTRGRPVVYLAEHPALALVERLVHLEIDPDDLPTRYQSIEVDMPDGTLVETVDVTALENESAGWRGDLALTRRIGETWLGRAAAALLRVPSVILPKSVNLLLNPLHPDAAQARIVETIQPVYDTRLFKT